MIEHRYLMLRHAAMRCAVALRSMPERESAYARGDVALPPAAIRTRRAAATRPCFATPFAAYCYLRLLPDFRCR